MVGALAAGWAVPPGNSAPELKPVVEVEDVVYRFEPADNGSDPLWCHGSTCIVQIGDDVVASGLERLADASPENNVRWLLLRRGPQGWQLQQADPLERTREPCPLAAFPDGSVWLSANPTLVEDRRVKRGPARPEILRFSLANLRSPPETILPVWQGARPAFTEHSYRSFAADGPRGELILFQNIGTTHAEWSFRDRTGRWAAQGQLKWPPYEDPKLEPYNAIFGRVNYPNVMLRDRAVHFCGIVAYNKWDRVRDDPALMGRERWGDRQRQLMYTWTPDIAAAPFRPWVEIANTFKDGGTLAAQDLWAAPDGRVHIVWSEKAINLKLRDLHFPDIKRVWAIKYAVVRNGEVTLRRTLVEGGEGFSGELPFSPRLQITPEGRMIMIYYVSGTSASGKPVAENRLMEIRTDGSVGVAVTLPMKQPLIRYFTATVRGGSAPSQVVDLMGYSEASMGRIYANPPSDPRPWIPMHYARIRLW